jgi:hypothetical protein
MAATLPKDQADLMFHRYDGGGITIQGPSVLVRKNMKERVSVYGNYYVDKVSSASIDVITSGASRYAEERTEYSLGADYLHDKTILSASGTQSSENDYEARTLSLGVSQDFFGDMTNLSMGFSQGEDSVRKTGDTTFAEDTRRKRYRLNLGQILTPSWQVSAGFEAVVDQGYLNNPYRRVHFRDGDTISWQTERYPNTRNSDTLAFRSVYYLPYKASIKGEWRNFSDNWGIKAQQYAVRYRHTYQKNWTFSLQGRLYHQTAADFYADLFDYRDFQQFLARDKEMSEFDSRTIGIGIDYRLPSEWVTFLDKASLHLQIDQMQFDYNNFRDATGRLQGASAFAPGEEPLYQLKANVIRLYFSGYY